MRIDYLELQKSVHYKQSVTVKNSSNEVAKINKLSILNYIFVEVIDLCEKLNLTLSIDYNT